MLQRLGKIRAEECPVVICNKKVTGGFDDKVTAEI